MLGREPIDQRLGHTGGPREQPRVEAHRLRRFGIGGGALRKRALRRVQMRPQAREDFRLFAREVAGLGRITIDVKQVVAGRQQVVGAARRERHDEADGLGGPGLGMHRGREHGGEDSGQQFHGDSPWDTLDSEALNSCSRSTRRWIFPEMVRGRRSTKRRRSATRSRPTCSTQSCSPPTSTCGCSRRICGRRIERLQGLQRGAQRNSA